MKHAGGPEGTQQTSDVPILGLAEPCKCQVTEHAALHQHDAIPREYRAQNPLQLTHRQHESRHYHVAF
jgi:hypothetical protein